MENGIEKTETAIDWREGTRWEQYREALFMVSTFGVGILFGIAVGLVLSAI